MCRSKLKAGMLAQLASDWRRVPLPRWLARYGFASVCVLGAFALHYALAPALGGQLPLLLFVPSTWISAYYGGVGPGLFALALGLLIGSYFSLPPPRGVGSLGMAQWIAMPAYICSAVMGVVMVEGLQRARRRIQILEREAERLRQQVEEQSRVEKSLRASEARFHELQALEMAREQLARHACDLESRVVERTAKLEESIRSLQGVLYHVAHDLRAPLRAMEGFTQILVEHQACQMDAASRDAASRIISAANRMDQLIQDLLAYGRLTHMEVTCRQIDLELQIDRVLAQLKDDITARQAKIDVCRPLPQVWANATVLNQILTSLISNALKFVDLNVPPQIRLGIENREAKVRLWVQDNGIGIDAAYREQIFHIFERLHAPDAYPGTGIGLAIARKGAERMGGAVGLDSAPGQGSCFWVELPAAPTVI
jgi:signal transduction histidine kinase